MRLLALAAVTLVAAGIGATPASANGYPPPVYHGRPGWHGYRQRVRRVYWRYHQRVRRCWWR